MNSKPKDKRGRNKLRKSAHAAQRSLARPGTPRLSKFQRDAAAATGHDIADHEWARRQLRQLTNVIEATRAFSEAMTAASVLTYMTSSTALQRDSAARLLCAIQVAQSLKVASQRAGDSARADYWLGMQCFAHAVCHVLEMWILLKKSDPHKAWVHKIDAEEYLGVARRALEQCGLDVCANLAAINELLARIFRLDNAVFPELKFMSPGLSYEIAHCSVCDEDLAVCPHIEGRIYCGRVCAKTRLKGAQINHLSLVGVPRDRRCIITQFQTSAGKRDMMTGEVVPGDPAQLNTAEAKVMSRIDLLPNLAD